MIYLASPYHHEDYEIMQQRFHAVAKMTAKFLRLELVVYSPIAHNHYLARNFDLPRDWSFWENLDLHMLDLAEGLYVLRLDGWEISKGVAAEIAYATKLGLAISYIDPE